MWLKYPGEMIIYTPREFHSHHTQVHLVTWYMHPWTVQQKIIVSNWGRTSWNLWMAQRNIDTEKTCKRTSYTFVKLMSCTKKSPEHLWLNNYLLNECTTFNHSPGSNTFSPNFFFYITNGNATSITVYKTFLSWCSNYESSPRSFKYQLCHVILSNLLNLYVPQFPHL